MGKVVKATKKVVKKVAKRASKKVVKKAPVDPLIGGPLLEGKARIDALKKFLKEVDAIMEKDEKEFYDNVPDDDLDADYQDDGLQQIRNTVSNAIWAEESKLGGFRW